jgi:hypothetical protein
MSDGSTDRSFAPTTWRDACGWIGWAVFALALVIAVAAVTEGFRAAVGQALHADTSLVTQSVDSAITGVWWVVGGALASVTLGALGRRWVLLTLSVLFLLFALALTQLRVGV